MLLMAGGFTKSYLHFSNSLWNCSWLVHVVYKFLKLYYLHTRWNKKIRKGKRFTLVNFSKLSFNICNKKKSSTIHIFWFLQYLLRTLTITFIIIQGNYKAFQSFNASSMIVQEILLWKCLFQIILCKNGLARGHCELLVPL